MNFTTEKRRELTSSIIKEAKNTETFEKAEGALNSVYGQKVEEDKTNRELYRVVNSQLSGYAYEYGLMTGYYHAMLLEQEYKYVVSTDINMQIQEERTFWGSPKLRAAAALEEGNEFHLNLNEGSTVWYPEHPLKYSRWVDDTHEEVGLFSPTEDEMFDMIRQFIIYYNTGGSGGDSEVTIFGEYKEFEMGLDTDQQQYMTVGYTEYIAGNGGFMTDGYDPSGDIILINGDDPDNFAIGTIYDAKTSPSRILFVPYVKKGIIPDNAIITSTFTSGNPVYIQALYSLTDQLREKYEIIHRFLDKNPDGDVVENVNMIEEIILIMDSIDGWKETQDINTLNSLITNIETIRHASREPRKTYIVDFLTTHPELYDDRWKILDLRLSKRMGTLREVMRNRDNIDFMMKIQKDKAGFLETFGRYFITIKCEVDGDYKRRVFIQDPNDIFKVGDEVYLLTDDPEIPEIKATIDIIIPARLELASQKVDENNEPIREFLYCKKVFFKDAWKDGKVKLKRFFPPTYMASDGFRIIKEVE